MKKQSFRNAAGFLAVCMMICALAVLPVTAADPDDHLILHYDFEGETLEEQLTDKAVNGTSAENLTVYDPSGNISVHDGVVKIPGTVQHYLEAKSAANGDFSEQKSAYTILIRFRTLDGENKDWTDLFQMTGLCQGIITTKTEFQIRACQYWKNKVLLNYSYTDWNTVAVVVNFDDKTVSTGFAGETLASNSFTKNGDLTSGMTITLGKLQGSDPTKKYNMDIEIDDFRVYDTALTSEEINEIQVGYCMNATEQGFAVTASTEELAQAAVLRTIEKQLNCPPVSVSLTDTHFTANESLVATVNYAVGSKLLRQENIRFSVHAPEVAYIGYQVSASLTEQNTFAIRWIGAVESLSYEGAGLEITSLAKGTTWETTKTGQVYSVLLGKTDDAELIEYRAPEGSYFTAYTIEKIPENTADTFTVRTFVIKDGEKLYGDTFELSFHGYAELK